MKYKRSLIVAAYCLLFLFGCTYKKTERAQSTFRIEDNHTADYYIRLGHLLKNQSNYSESIESYTKALQLSSDKAAIHDSMCVVYNAQTNFKEAIIAGQKAMNLNPELTQNILYAYCQNGDWEKAEKIYNKIIINNPKNLKAISELNDIKPQLTNVKISKLFITIIILLLIFFCFFYFFKKKNNSFLDSLDSLKLLLISSSVTCLFYFLFFHFSEFIWSFNLKIPTEELTKPMLNFIVDKEHDGVEGYVLYSLMFVIIISTYILTHFFIIIKNKTANLLLFLVLLIITSIFFINIGFFPPMTSFDIKNTNFILIAATILAITFLNLLSTKLPDLLFWIILILFLIPICFIAVDSISIFDYSFILLPAMKILEGHPVSEIYFQYDLFLSLLAALWMKLHFDINLLQIVGQFSFFLFFIGVFIFSKHFFFNKKLAIYVLFSLIITRYYSIYCEPVACLQVTPLRLDLWLILLLLVYYKGIYNWAVGMFLGLLLVAHKNFGLIYLISYYEVIGTLFFIDFYTTTYKNFNLISLKYFLVKQVLLNIKNIAIVIIFLIFSILLFKTFSPESAILYQKVGIGMMKISIKSFYWYLPILFGLVFTLLLKYRNAFTQKHLSTGLFILFLAIGNSIYFFGRSHEHNILNISGLLILVLFLFFDIIFFEQITLKTESSKKNLITILVSALPIILIIFSLFFYSKRITNKIKTQYYNYNHYQPISPFPVSIPDKEFLIIKKLTNNSKKVYFINYCNDFIYYYYGNYSPKGYYSPCISWVLKNDFVTFLQNLLDDNYFLISNGLPQIEDILPKINYNKTVSENGLVCISKVNVKHILPPDKKEITHIGFEGNLGDNGIYHSPITLSTNFTIEIVLKLNYPITGTNRIVGNFDETIEPRGFVIQQNGTNNNDYSFTYGNGKSVTSKALFKLDENKWNYLVIIVKGKTIRIFNNGKLLYSENSAMVLKNSNTPLILGNIIGQNKTLNVFLKEIKITNDTISKLSSLNYD